MATGFTLSIGYISGATWRGGENSAFAELREATKEYIASSRFARALGAIYGKQYKGEIVGDYARQYRANTGNPISFNEDEQFIFISCSGGGASRELKEMAALHLCAHVIAELAVQGIPVNLSIA